uniref:Uncharacterized protein n=1 Tax=Tanacetum cinerariifolium TaxID=118510 RepID=A0A6L2JLZ0_TANCI|nr:hypothetical protein CTI12_AA274910 [Tanacetum cinerariifolium]
MAFPRLQELTAAENSNSLIDAMSVYIQRKINDDLQFTAGLSHLREVLYSIVQEHKLLTAKLNVFGGPHKPDREAMWVHCEIHHSRMGYTTTNRGLAATGTTSLVVGQGLGRGNTTILVRGDYLIGIGIRSTTTGGLAGGLVVTGTIIVPKVDLVIGVVGAICFNLDLGARCFDLFVGTTRVIHIATFLELDPGLPLKTILCSSEFKSSYHCKIPDGIVACFALAELDPCLPSNTFFALRAFIRGSLKRVMIRAFIKEITGSTELHKRMRFWFMQEIAKEEGFLRFLRDRCDDLRRHRARRRVFIGEMEALGSRGVAVDSLDCLKQTQARETNKLDAFTEVLPETKAGIHENEDSHAFRHLYEQINISPSPGPSHGVNIAFSGGSNLQQSCSTEARSCQHENITACLTYSQSVKSGNVNPVIVEQTNKLPNSNGRRKEWDD